MDEEAPPLLVVEGPYTIAFARFVPIALALAFQGAAVGSLVARHRGLLWVPAWLQPYEMFVFVASSIGGALAALAVHHHLWIRAGSVSFFEDRIVVERFKKGAVRWEEVAGFRDGQDGMVEIVSNQNVLSTLTNLTAPARGEAERTAILELLTKRGVKRLD